MIPDATVFWIARREDGRIIGGAEEVWAQTLGPTGWVDADISAEDFPTDGPARDEWAEMFGEIVLRATSAGFLDARRDETVATGPWHIEASALTLKGHRTP